MTTPSKLHGLLGMAKRAGKLSVGFDAATAAVKNGEAELLVIAADCSPKTEKECRFVLKSFEATIIKLPLDRAAFAAAIGVPKLVAVAAVCDNGFATAIRSYCPENKEEDSL